MSPRHAMMKVSKLKAPFGLQPFLQKAAENSLTSATFDLHEGGQQTNILKKQLESFYMKIYLNFPHFRSSGNFRVHMRSCSKSRKGWNNEVWKIHFWNIKIKTRNFLLRFSFIFLAITKIHPHQKLKALYYNYYIYIV